MSSVKTLEPPLETGPRILHMRCANKRCRALLEVYETEVKTEQGDRPFDPDSHYVTCIHCRERAYEEKAQ